MHVPSSLPRLRLARGAYSAAPRPFAELYHYAWFVGFAVAFVTYLA
jgi:cytosine/uracil/thiamine/allantoin permease